MMDKISDGRFVVVRRGLSDRVVNFSSQKSVHFGKGSSHVEIELKNADGCQLFSSFNIVKNGKKFVLEKNETYDATHAIEESSRKCGTDNRNIVDVRNKSAEEIEQMKKDGMSGKEILDSIISTSKNFELKTEYSQDKYLKKKMLHYADSLHFLPVDLPFLCRHYRTISVEALSQLLTFGNIHANGNYVVYETGMNGVVVAGVMKRLGGLGNCLHVHLGSCPQRQAVNYMNFQTLKTLRSLDVFYLDRESQSENSEQDGNGPPENKKARVEVNLNTTNRLMNEESIKFLKEESMDGLLMAGKEHPLPLLKKLIPFLSPSSPLAIYSQWMEPLLDVYDFLKGTSKAVNVQIVDNFYRAIQVEVDRTHPEITMASGGYLLFAILVT